MNDDSGVVTLGVGLISIIAIIILSLSLVGVANGIMDVARENLNVTLEIVEEQEASKVVTNENNITEIEVKDDTTSVIVKDKDVEVNIAENQNSAGVVVSGNNNDTTVNLGNQNYSINYEAPKDASAGMWVAICFGIIGLVVIVVAILVYKFHKDKEEREHTEYVLEKSIKTIASGEVEELKKKY